MKRFLSILLIAAGLFSLYGDYVNITDVLACKTYWEETSKKSEDDLNALGAGLTKLKKNRKSYDKAVKQLAKGKKSLAAAEAKDATVGAKMSKLKSDYKKGVDNYMDLSYLIKDISTARTAYKTWKTSYDKLASGRKSVIKAVSGPDPDKLSTVNDLLTVDIAELIYDKAEREAFTAAVRSLNNDEQTADGYKTFAAHCDTVSAAVDSLYTTETALYKAAKTIVSLSTDEELIGALKGSQELYDAAVGLVRRDFIEGDYAQSVVEGAVKGDETDLQTIRDCSDKTAQKQLLNNYKSLKWLRYYVTNSMKTYSTSVKSNADKLAKGQATISKQVSSIASAILGTSSYKNAVRRSMGKKTVTLLEDYKKKKNPLSISSTNFAGFEKQMDKTPGLNASLLKAQKLLYTSRTDLKKDVTKTKTRYTASYRTYKAYPKKLDTARKKLEKLEEQIATYEDGEKASKKGLKTLVNEEPDGDLESIKDRVGGDANFNDSKGNLDLDKGMEAVDAGEAYLNEAGDMITNELLGRAIGTAAAIGAAILALLAALLSLFRSNRGGAMLACIAAIVAAAGTALGESAGDVFSALAGSKVGELPWAAAMVLAGVAMVFAIVHFAAKPEE